MTAQALQGNSIRIHDRSGSRTAFGVAALTGIAYFILGFATPQPEGPVPANATAEQIRSYVSQNASALRLQATLVALGIALVLVFIGALAHLARRYAPESMAGEVMLGAGALTVLSMWVAAATDALPTVLWTNDHLALSEVSDPVLQGWYGLHSISHFFGDYGLVPTCLVMGAYSLAALRASLLPRPLAWVGLAVAVAGVIGVVGVMLTLDVVAALWFVGMFGWFFWTFAVSIVCGLRWRQARRSG